MTINWKHEWQAFWLCLGFISRIPMLARIDYSQQLMNHSSMYFPLAGLVLGAAYALVYQALAIAFPLAVTVIGVVIVHLWLTGAFHEDGLADMVDALGGGFTVERRLAIMKDSRIGTYGTVALVGALALKVALLLALAPLPIWAVLLFTPALARVTPLFLMAVMPYVTDTDTSKTKPVANTFPMPRLAVATAFSVALAGVGLFWLPGLVMGFVVTTALVGLLWGRQLHRALGGYTGDALGASIVLTELALLAFLVAL
ncbi:adenosylcobinamide-GDP ribazoletransferase [Halomonadaceae bacterium KBTZ08]